MKIELHRHSPLPVPEIICMGCWSETEMEHYIEEDKTDYIICYVIRGEVFYNGNPVWEGKGFWAFPDMQRECRTKDREKTELVWVRSKDERMRGIFDSFLADPYTLIFQYEYIPAVKNAFDQLVIMHKLETGYFDMYGIFVSLMQAHFNLIRGGCKSSSELYLQFSRRYIRDSIAGNLRIEDLAEKLGISQAHLYRIFKTHLGILLM